MKFIKSCKISLFFSSVVLICVCMFTCSTFAKGTISLNSGKQYVNTSPIPITLDLGDDNTSGVKMFISTKNSTPTASTTATEGINTGWIDYNTSYSWTYTGADGTVTLYAWFKDEAGNISSVISDSIIFDKTPPSGTLTINDDSSTTNPLVTLYFTKKYNLADVNQIIISNSSDFSTFEIVPYIDTVSNWTISGSSITGTKTVYVKYLDWAGNYSQPFNASIQYQYIPASSNYEVVNEYNSLIGIVDEKVAGFDGYSIVDKYAPEGNLYVVFKSNSAIKIIDWQGNLIYEKNIGNGFDYIGVANGYIIYKLNNNCYRDCIRYSNPQLIASISNYTTQLTPEGLLVAYTYSHVSRDYQYYIDYTIKAWDVNNNVFLYQKSGTFSSYKDYWCFFVEANGWNVFINNYETDNRSSGCCYFIDKSGTLSESHHWSDNRQANYYAVSSALGLVIYTQQDSYSYFRLFTKTSQTNENPTIHYDWNRDLTLDTTYWWQGDFSRVLIKERGTGAGSLYKVVGVPLGRNERSDVNILYCDNDYILATIGSSKSDYWSGRLYLLQANHFDKTLNSKWSMELLNYPSFVGGVDKENNKIFIYAKFDLYNEITTDVLTFDFETGKVVGHGKFAKQLLDNDIYYAKDTHLFYAKDNIIYRRTFITAGSSTNSSTTPKVVTVINGVNFSTSVEGVFSGEYKNADKSILVTGVSDVENECTTVSGKITLQLENEQFKNQKVTIGGQKLIFRVIAPPSLGGVAKVSFK